MPLRPYQQKYNKEILDALSSHQRVLGVLPTGGGKTYCNCMLAEYATKVLNMNVLVVVHRDYLMEQWTKTLYDITKISPKIIKGGTSKRKLTIGKLNVASIGSLVNRLNSIHPNSIDLIIVDEAHHCVASTYIQMMEYFGDTNLVGPTATPVRTDGKGFDEFFGHMVMGPTPMELIEMGWLLPAKVKMSPLPEDLESQLQKYRKKNGDINDKGAGKLMSSDSVLPGIYSNWEEHAKDLQTIAFAQSVGHSEEIVGLFREKGVTAAHIDGKTKKETRKRLIREFKQGKIQVLSNYNIFTEGFDLPKVGCVLFARYTESLGLWMQAAGRAARPENKKRAPGEHYLLLDVGGNYPKFGAPQDERQYSLNGKVKHKKKVIEKEENDEPEEEVKVMGNGGHRKEMEWIDEIKLVDANEDLNLSIIKPLITQYENAAKYKKQVYNPWIAYFRYISKMNELNFRITFRDLVYWKGHFEANNRKINPGWVNVQYKQYNK